MKDSNQQQIEGKQGNLFPKKRHEMSVPERVQTLQRNLYLKAKQEPGYKFYVLYDKISLDYVLKESWYRVKEQNGSAGIDKQTFKEIEEAGVAQFLSELKESLSSQLYQASPVKRVWIPKANGGQRPLGIPTIRDRVAQMACKIVIEPIFEADFEAVSHGFRPKQSAHGAISQIKEHLKDGKTEVFDADLSKYFDTIPHDKLKITLRQRIADKRVMYLIDKWLKAPVWEDGEFKGGKNNKVGTPQGGVISPLLANIYLNLLDKIVCSEKSIFGKIGIKIVRYADDFVLMARQIPEEAITRLQGILDRMGLKLNEEKSKKVNAQRDPFQFLGFEFRYRNGFIYEKGKPNPRKTGKYFHVEASSKSQKKLRQKINDKLHKIGHYSPDKVAAELNLIIKGSLNYYHVKGLTYAGRMKRNLNQYLWKRLNTYYRRKSQRRSRLYCQQAYERLKSRYGLIDPLL